MKKDSLVYAAYDSSYLSIISNNNTVKILFDEKDTIKNTAPIIVTTKGDSTKIDAGGRKVKAIETTHNTNKIDSGNVGKKDISKLNTYGLKIHRLKGID